MHFVHLKTSVFFRVLRSRDRIVRSNTWFIHRLLALGTVSRIVSAIWWQPLHASHLEYCQLHRMAHKPIAAARDCRITAASGSMPVQYWIPTMP